MKGSKRLVLLLGAMASMVWMKRGEDGPSRLEPARVAAVEVAAPGRVIPAAAAWRPAKPAAGLEPREREPGAPLREDIDALSTADLDAELDAVIGDAESYWELSEEGRRQYDALEAARLRRLGVADVIDRLAPWTEVLTLDGQPVEVTP